MSWFSSAVSIDDKVEAATSESLPSGEQDLALNLEICDIIRSKTVAPKDAMRSLKRRLAHKNPNVQILTLHLLDICIKNGGSHFLAEIASREFMDSFVSILKPVSGSVHPDVKELMLEYLQNWSNAFKGQIQLNYVDKIHDQLIAEGFQFPAGSKINASFIDSSAPPEWVDSDVCMISGTPFSFVNRKHHCRNCGGCFTQKYCNNYITLPHLGINQPVRVCDNCFEKYKPGGKGGAPAPPTSATSASRTSNNQDLAGPIDDEDADLKRALELSLSESQSTPGLVKPAEVARPAPSHDSDDEDMKAAIAASLRDMELETQRQPTQQPRAVDGLYQMNDTGYPNAGYSPADSRPDAYGAPAGAPQQAPMQAPPQEDEFSPLEAEIIHRYVQLVQDLQKAPPGAVLRETKLQQLNDSVTALRPKLARDLRQTIEKCEKLEEMHGKLTAVVRYYDKILEDRFSYTTQRYRMPQTHTGGSSQYSYGMPQSPQASVGAPSAPSYGQGYPPQEPQYYQSQPSAPPGYESYEPPLQSQQPPQPQYGTAPGGPIQRQATDDYYPVLHDGPAPAQPEPKKPEEEPILIEL